MTVKTHKAWLIDSQVYGEYSPKLISAAREWLLDCFENDNRFIDEMDADEIIQTVDVLYVGGWMEFIADGADNDDV